MKNIPRNKYPEETRKKILKVAKHLFLTKGYEHTTILDIVEGLQGMTRGAFYHHFKSKEEVFDAIITLHYDQQNPVILANQQSHLNGLEKLKYILNKQLNTEISEEDLQLTKLSISLLDNPLFLANHVKSNRDIAVILAEIIEKGMADGSIRNGNALVLAELLLLTINHWFFPSIYPFNEETANDKIYIVKEIFDHLGMPLFDDKIISQLEDFAQAFDWGKKNAVR